MVREHTDGPETSNPSGRTTNFQYSPGTLQPESRVLLTSHLTCYFNHILLDYLTSRAMSMVILLVELHYVPSRTEVIEVSTSDAINLQVSKWVQTPPHPTPPVLTIYKDRQYSRG